MMAHAHRATPSLPGSIVNLQMMSPAAVLRKRSPMAVVARAMQGWPGQTVSFLTLSLAMAADLSKRMAVANATLDSQQHHIVAAALPTLKTARKRRAMFAHAPILPDRTQSVMCQRAPPLECIRPAGLTFAAAILIGKVTGASVKL